MAGKSVPGVLHVTREQVAEFWKTFVNRRAYIQQSYLPGGKSGRYCYFRPTTKKEELSIPLKPETHSLAHYWPGYSWAGCDQPGHSGLEMAGD